MLIFLGRAWGPQFLSVQPFLHWLGGHAVRLPRPAACSQSYERKEATRIGSKKKDEQHTRKQQNQNQNQNRKSNKEKEAEQEQAQAEQILCIEQSPPDHYFLSINPPLINQTPLSRAKQRR